MEIHFYKYTGKPNVIEKVLPTEYTTLNGTMVNEFNIDNPILKVINYDFDFNYCYIAELNKYYWVDDVTINPNGYYILNMSIDVLYTFKDEIQKSLITVSETAPYSTTFNPATYYDPRLRLFNTSNIINENPFKYNLNEQSIILIALNTGS